MKLANLILLWIAVAMLPTLVWAADDKNGDLGALATDTELVETRTSLPHLKEAGTYVVKDNTIAVELSEYAGYSGLIVANGGMDPSENSLFFKKHHFKVKLSLSEEEASGRLNHGDMAASATTADVLPVSGKHYEVVVPAQIGFSRGADGIVVRSDIKRVNDLKGKVLSCCQFTESDFFIRYLAQEAGMAVNMLLTPRSAIAPGAPIAQTQQAVTPAAPNERTQHAVTQVEGNSDNRHLRQEHQG